MLGRSMFKEFDEDPFFAGASQRMRLMDRAFGDPFGGSGSRRMLEDGGRGRERGGHRERHSNEITPFDPDFSFGNMFENMNKMMRGMQDNMQHTMRGFENAAADPNGHSFHQASFMSYSNTGEGPPKVYQASTSTRRAPGGVKETRKALRDSEANLEKMAIGHHIHDRGHMVERHKNTSTGHTDERQNFLNMEEADAPSFDREFREKIGQSKGRLDYDHRGRNRDLDRRRGREERHDQRRALPPSRTEHWGRTPDEERGYRDRK